MWDAPSGELLFTSRLVRDIVYVSTQIEAGRFDLEHSSGLTHAVFEILRNARVLRAHADPNLIVCWGGHSIPRHEYDYTKQVGYQLGLRGFDICTGCGPGAMKGPMKGATIAHAKQRRKGNRPLVYRAQRRRRDGRVRQTHADRRRHRQKR